MGTVRSASFWSIPISTRNSEIGMAFLVSPGLSTWGGRQVTTPKIEGCVSTVSSRSGSMRGSTPPMVRKRRNPSSTPVTIRPISSK